VSYKPHDFLPWTTALSCRLLTRHSPATPHADVTTLSIDSGDIDTVERYSKTGLVTDATTNPLFVSQAGQNGDERYEAMVNEAIVYAKKITCSEDGETMPIGSRRGQG